MADVTGPPKRPIPPLVSRVHGCSTLNFVFLLGFMRFTNITVLYFHLFMLNTPLSQWMISFSNIHDNIDNNNILNIDITFGIVL